jgi:hypothetical protein
VEDNSPPSITCPPDEAYANCDHCVGVGVATATDDCDNDVSISYSDSVSGTCPSVITRTWTATDDCGNQATCAQTITCLLPSLVTDSSLCTYDLDPGGCNNFRLIFTPDPQNWPCYKLTASNPGQTFFNVFASGMPGDTLTLTLSIPYPYVTQGANPLHAYDGVSVVPSSTGGCLTPGNGIPVTLVSGSIPVTLGSYSGSTYILTVKVIVPASGFVYVNLHLDYGLKGTGGLTKNSMDDAVNCANTAQVLIPNGGTYTFSVSGPQSGWDSICNINVFKRNPGVAGLALTTLSRNPVPGATVALRNSQNVQVGSAVTDADGYYQVNYKHTGKAANYTARIVFGDFTQTKTVTLKANAFLQVDWDVPEN